MVYLVSLIFINPQAKVSYLYVVFEPAGGVFYLHVVFEPAGGVSYLHVVFEPAAGVSYLHVVFEAAGGGFFGVDSTNVGGSLRRNIAGTNLRFLIVHNIV